MVLAILALLFLAGTITFILGWQYGLRQRRDEFHWHAQPRTYSITTTWPEPDDGLYPRRDPRI